MSFITKTQRVCPLIPQFFKAETTLRSFRNPQYTYHVTRRKHIVVNLPPEPTPLPARTAKAAEDGGQILAMLFLGTIATVAYAKDVANQRSKF